MDNRIFNVNGSGKDMLIETIRIALWQRAGDSKLPTCLTAVGYTVDQQTGLVFLWNADDKDHQKFLVSHTSEMLGELAYKWLHSDQAKLCLTHLTDWDEDHDHDGHNSLGWRVYCEDWGHVGSERYSIVAVKPVYLWHGK